MIKQADGSYLIDSAVHNWHQIFLVESVNPFDPGVTVRSPKLVIKRIQNIAGINTAEFGERFLNLLNHYFTVDFHLEVWPDNIAPVLMDGILNTFEDCRANFMREHSFRKPPTLLLQYDTFIELPSSMPNSANSTPSRRSEASPHGSPGGYVSPPRPGTAQFDEARAMTPPRRTLSPQALLIRDSDSAFIRGQIQNLEMHDLARSINFSVLYYDGNIGTYVCVLDKRPFYFTLSSSNERIIFWSNGQFFNTDITMLNDLGRVGREVAVEGYFHVVIKDLTYGITEPLRQMIDRGYDEGYFT